jgi:hypothetical protein
MRLEHHHFSAAWPASLSGRQCGLNLTGVMCVIIHKKCSTLRKTDIAQHLKPSPDPTKCRKTLLNR